MTTVNRCDQLRDEDQEFFERELASFIPDRVFDVHCHLWKAGHLQASEPSLLSVAAEMGYDECAKLLDWLHPGRRCAVLFIPWIVDEPLLQDANKWVAKQLAVDSSCRSLFMVKPDDDPEWLRQEVHHLGASGLKCYHSFAKTKPTWEADLPDYLPERIVKVANDEGWVIMLHMVKRRGLADPGNIHWISHYCRTYPNMKLILAHSARGFQPAHNFSGLPKLVGLDNLYFDCSLNCEPMAHAAVIRIMGHKKLMYGSDFFGSHLRGRSVAAEDSFLWLYENTPVWTEAHTRIKPVLIGLEQLRSLKWACWSERLTHSDVEDIFWNNAAQLFNID